MKYLLEMKYSVRVLYGDVVV